MSNKFILVLMAVMLMAVVAACVPSYVRGSGRIVQENRPASGFKRIVLEGFGEVQVAQAETEGLKVEADDNLLRYIKTEVRGDVLHLSYAHKSLEILDPSQPVRFYINMKEIAGLEVAGSGRIQSERVTSDTLELEIGGSGRVELGQVVARKVEAGVSGSGNVRITGLQAHSLAASIDGSGRLELAGTVDQQSIQVHGSGNYLAGDLHSGLAQVDIDGSGNVEIDVTGSLDVDISGSGRVAYRGQPKVSQRVSGSGRIRSLDAD